MKVIKVYIAMNELGAFEASNFASEAADRLLDTYGAKTIRTICKHIVITDCEGEVMSDQELTSIR